MSMELDVILATCVTERNWPFLSVLIKPVTLSSIFQRKETATNIIQYVPRMHGLGLMWYVVFR